MCLYIYIQKNQYSNNFVCFRTLYERVVQLEQKHRQTELQLEQKNNHEQKTRELILKL